MNVLFVFFFKQKTAYEMRISDWSSDVCSSDLPHDRGRVPHRQAGFHPQGKGEAVAAEEQRLEPPPALPAFAEPLPRLGRHLLQRPEGKGGDRQSVVQGKSVSVRIDLGGRRIYKTKTNNKLSNTLTHSNQ